MPLDEALPSKVIAILGPASVTSCSTAGDEAGLRSVDFLVVAVGDGETTRGDGLGSHVFAGRRVGEGVFDAEGLRLRVAVRDGVGATVDFGDG